MKEGWNVILRYDADFEGVKIWFINKQGEQHSIICPINLTITTSYTDFAQVPEPTIRIGATEAHQFLQGLADGLVDAGFRPDELKCKDSEIQVLRNHLEDMRTLVFDALLPPEVPPPRLERGRIRDNADKED